MNTNKTLIRLIGAMAALVLLTGEARALILYDNLRPNDGFAGTFDLVSGTQTNNGRVDLGFKFTAVATGELEKIFVGMGLTAGRNELFLDLYADDGNYPETLIKGWSFQNKLPDIVMNQQNLPPVTIFDVRKDKIKLEKDKTYWLIAASDPSGVILWFRNSTGATGNQAFRTNGGEFKVSANSNVTAGSLRLAVPEPPIAALLVMGWGLMGIARKRSRR
jgi:hypothetical protein